MRVGLAILAVALAGACHRPWGRARHLTVACLGDSNTMANWPSGPTPRWCEYLARELAGWTFVNEGFGGMTVCDFAPLHGNLPWAIPQLEAARAAHPDVVIAAFGTNDVKSLHESPPRIVDCYRKLAAAAAPARILIATTPPILPPGPDYHTDIDALNALLRDAFPTAQLIDFHEGFGPALFLPDGIHLSDEGQRVRAKRAAAALLHEPGAP